VQASRPPGEGGLWPSEKVACRIPTPLPLQNYGTLICWKKLEQEAQRSQKTDLEARAPATAVRTE
jgi:hypothetical protein